MTAPAAQDYTPMEQLVSGEVDDVATLTNLTGDTLLDELKIRYNKDVIYTFVSDILVAVNPFKRLPLYGEEQMKAYNNKKRDEVKPHVYTIADACYHNLFTMKKNQCAVISGESGAGKTESAKFIINYIIELCKAGTYGTNLETQIIKISPLLEAFGNAQTNMNRNSSRFGKYTRLLFDAKGSVMGVQLSECLLEKSRVVKQIDGERNFHVFYYMFAHPNAAGFGLTQPADYCILGGDVWGDNQQMFNELLDALRVVGFADPQLDTIFAILAACVHLGNLRFASEGERAIVESEDVLAQIAALLKVDVNSLRESFLGVTTITRGETIRRHYSKETSGECRDSLAKTLYGSLFGWIVNAVNELLAPELHQKRAAGGRPGLAARIAPTFEIGVLDIFGFENFSVNSFEQMCINIAHEQLQYFFNHHTFGIEQEEYIKEGIDSSKVSFRDNEPLLDAFLAKHGGVFALLDEECTFPKATDQSFADKVVHHYGEKPFLAPSSRNRGFPVFVIKHFAAEVEYTCTNILEKNKDNLSGDIVDVMRESELDIVYNVFWGEITNTGQIKPKVNDGQGPRVRRGKEIQEEKDGNKVNRRTPTLSTQFKNSLAVLMERMTACYPHFVRCIKPNMRQRADCFEDDMVKVQLSYTGVLEATRIRREGYAWRPTFSEFVSRYKVIAFPVSKLRMVQESARTSRKILEHANMQNYQIGKTKLFLRYYHMERMEAALRKFYKDVVYAETAIRGYLARRLRGILEERRRMSAAERAAAEAQDAEEKKRMEEERRRWQQQEEEMRLQEEEQRLEIMRVERETLEAEARAAEERGLAKEEEARLAAAEAERAAAHAQATQTIKEVEAAWSAKTKAEALAEEARMEREEALRLAEEALMRAEQTELEMEQLALQAEEAKRAKEAAEKEAENAKVERQKSRKKRKDDAERLAAEARQRAEQEALAAEQARKNKEEADIRARAAEEARREQERRNREQQEKEMEEQLRIMEEEAKRMRALAEEQGRAAEEARLAKERADEIARKAEQERLEEEARLAEERALEEAEARAGDYTRDDFNLPMRVSQILEGPTPSDVQFERRTAKGHLKKVGHSRRTWKDRFFVMDISEMALHYFENEKSKKPKGTVSLTKVLRAFAPSPPNPKEPTLFMIETVERTFYLHAPSIEALRAWIVALNIVPVHNNRTSISH